MSSKPLVVACEGNTSVVTVCSICCLSDLYFKKKALKLDGVHYSSVQHLSLAVEAMLLAPQQRAVADMENAADLHRIREFFARQGESLGLAVPLHEVRLLSCALGLLNHLARSDRASRYLDNTGNLPIMSLGERASLDQGVNVAGNGQNIYGRLLSTARALRRGVTDLTSLLDDLFGPSMLVFGINLNAVVARSLLWAHELLALRDIPTFDVLVWTFAMLSPGLLHTILAGMDEQDPSVEGIRAALNLDLGPIITEEAQRLFYAHLRTPSPRSPSIAGSVTVDEHMLNEPFAEVSDGESSSPDNEYYSQLALDALAVSSSSQPSTGASSQQPSIANAPALRVDAQESHGMARYLVAQAQAGKIIGIILNPQQYPEWPKYLALVVAERGEIDPRLRPPAEFELGQQWEVSSFTWRSNEGGRYLQLLEEEAETGSYQDHADREARLQGPATAVFQDSLNYQAVAAGHLRLVHAPQTEDVLGRIVERRAGTLRVAANGLIRTARVESWNIVGGPHPDGNWIALKINRLPNHSRVGARVVFPPGNDWCPADCLSAEEVWVVAHARIITNWSDIAQAWLMEAQFAANNMMCIEEEMQRAKKFSFRSCLSQALDIQSNTILVELIRGDSKDTQAQFSGLLHRFRAGRTVDFQLNLSSEPLFSGRVIQPISHMDGHRRRFSVTVRPFDSQEDVREGIAQSIAIKTEFLIRIPPHVETLQLMQQSMFRGSLVFHSAGISHSSTILRKVMCLEPQGHLRCPHDHLDHSSRRLLNRVQAEVANLFNCLCTEGQLLVVNAPFGTGKSTTVRRMVYQLVVGNLFTYCAVSCTTNKPLIAQALKIAEDLRNSGVDFVLALGKEAQRAYAQGQPSWFRGQHLITEAVNRKTQRHEFVGGPEVVEKLKERRPRVIIATCDKLVRIADALGFITHLTGDELGRLPRLQLAHIVSKCPQLRTLHVTGDVKQFGVYNRDFSEHLHKDPTGFDSSLKTLEGFHSSHSFSISYRAHPALTQALSTAIYNGDVRSGVEVQHRGVLGASTRFHLPVQDFPAALIQLSQRESHEAWSTSSYNLEEIDAVLRIYSALRHEFPTCSFLFMCSYELTIAKFLEEASRRNLYVHRDWVKSVDEVIGDEADFVFLLLTRTSPGNWDFLQQEERVVVGWTRARMGLFVLGSFTHYASTGVAGRLVSEFARHTPIVDLSYVDLLTGEALRVRNVLVHPTSRRSIISRQVDGSSLQTGGGNQQTNGGAKARVNNSPEKEPSPLAKKQRVPKQRVPKQRVLKQRVPKQPKKKKVVIVEEEAEEEEDPNQTHIEKYFGPTADSSAAVRQGGGQDISTAGPTPTADSSAAVRQGGGQDSSMADPTPTPTPETSPKQPPPKKGKKQTSSEEQDEPRDEPDGN